MDILNIRGILREVINAGHTSTGTTIFCCVVATSRYNRGILSAQKLIGWNTNMRKMRKWRDVLIVQLAADREAATGFLQAVLEDYQIYGDSAALASALRVVVESRGGISEFTKQTGIKPQILSKVLAREEALRIDTLGTIFKALGCRLSIEQLETERPCAEMGNADASVAPTDSVVPDMELATDNQ